MTARGARIGCYPGSFNPPTVAHLAVAEAACAAAALDRVDLVVSRVALGKALVEVPTLEDRLAVLAEVAASRPWLGVAVSDARLVADLAAGYDAVVMGADKWRQVLDPAWYGGEPAARDAALARLPQVLVAPRRGDDLTDLLHLAAAAGGGPDIDVDVGPARAGRVGPRSTGADGPRAGAGGGPGPDGPPVLVLPVAEHHREVNATAVRDGSPGARAWMLPEAAALDERTGAWSDPARYRPT